MKKYFAILPLSLFLLSLCLNSCSKDDLNNSDDNSNTNVSNVSAGIKAYVASKYSSYSIYEIEKEDWCKDQYFIKVGIRKGSQELHLGFDNNETYLFQATRITEGQLPSAVSSARNKQFAGYEIKDDNDVEELLYPDNSKRYYLRLRKSGGGGGSDVRVMFLANGNIFCQRN